MTIMTRASATATAAATATNIPLFLASERTRMKRRMCRKNRSSTTGWPHGSSINWKLALDQSPVERRKNRSCHCVRTDAAIREDKVNVMHGNHAENKNATIINRDPSSYDGGHEDGQGDENTNKSDGPISPLATPSSAPTDCTLLAAIDCGTHSFRLVVVRANPDGQFKVIERHKEEVRLGSGSGMYSIITEERQEHAIAALKRLTEIAYSKLGDNKWLKIVATSALREARNKDAVLKRLENATKTEIQVISGMQEGTLTYLGVIRDVPVRDKKVVLIDIGGGSTEIVSGYKGDILYPASIKLGHVRLTERWLPGTLKDEKSSSSHSNDGKKEIVDSGIGEIEHLVNDMRRGIQVALFDSGVVEAVITSLQVLNDGEKDESLFDLAIGSSGTIISLHSIISNMRQYGTESPLGASASENNIVSLEFTQTELNLVINRLIDMYKKKAPPRISGVTVSRNQTILAGAILLDELFIALGIKKMRVSQNALREGVIVDYMEDVLPLFTSPMDIRRDGVMSVARRFDSEGHMNSLIHLEGLSLQLARELQRNSAATSVANQLDEQCLELIGSACILHSVGMFINHSGHHKHAQYIIKHAESLTGFSPIELEVIALLVRYHRKKPPGRKAIENLPEEWKFRFRAMAAIVRMAIALDRRNSGVVSSVSILKNDSLRCCVLIVDAKEDDDINTEMWCAREELHYFDKVFDLDTRIEKGPIKTDSIQSDPFGASS